jgi:acylpyruvate hydrolase
LELIKLIKNTDKGVIFLKLLTFSLGNDKPKIGGLTKTGYVIDLQRCLSKCLTDTEGIERGQEIASALIPNDMTEFIRGGSRSLEAAKLALEYGSRRQQEFTDAGILVPESKITFWPPVNKPGKIICAGKNFTEHVRERGAALPELPIAFVKVQSALVGHQWPVIIKRNMQLVDYEVEVAVIIGKRVESIPKEEALDCVLGYSVFNDVSERAFQLKEMAKGSVMAGKNFDTFAPMGPYLVTKDEVGSPGDLNLNLKVNGVIRQKSNTKNMIFDIPTLINYWSNIMTLEPGDIMTTGTPGGVAMAMKPDPMPFYLKPGDLMEAEVEGLGILTNPVKKE